MSKKGQIFYRESKLKFYLRNSHSTHPCQIYLVASIDGKRYRIYTKMKVYASQWDQERQLAVISNVQSKQDNRNNKIANNYLNKLRGYFSEFIEYICNNNVDDIAETLKKFINRDMAKKKINLVYVAADALEYYHSYVKPSIKDSTKRQSESLLSEFGRFVDTLREKDKTMQIFSQRGLNMYKEYLIDKMNKSKEDDSRRNFGVGQLNRCGAIIALLINKVLVPQEKAPSPVVWIKVDDPRREDQMGHIPLLDNEVAAIESCSGLTPVEEEYRDVFLLHLECGQRVSDLAKLLTGNYKVKQGKKYKYIVVSTTKENINAIIPITPKVTMLMDKIKNHTLVDPKEFEEKTKGKGNNTYNEAIRRIAKKAGLDREIVKIDSTQKEVRKPLYKTVSSHDARCTFITNMIKKGVSPERLCRMTGHANDEMIKRVYAQLTVEDEINRIESDLYSDVDDDEANLPIDVPSQKQTEIKSVIQETTTISNPIDQEPSSFFDSYEFLTYKDYIKGLNDCVDAAISDYGFLPPDFDFETTTNFIQRELKLFYKTLSKHKRLFKSKKHVITIWKSIEKEITKDFRQDPNCPKYYIDSLRLYALKNLMDYLREIHVKKDVIDSLDIIFHRICEENPNASLISREMPHIKVLWPIFNFLKVLNKMIPYIQENRPIPDKAMIENDCNAFKIITKWDLVFRELQKTPAMKLETLIQNTMCRDDVKTVLYNSIKNGDFNRFNETIITHEQEVRILINHSYLNQFLRTQTQLIDHLMKEINRVEDPIEMINQFTEILELRRPYVDNDYYESTPGFLKKDIHDIDVKELSLWLLDIFLNGLKGIRDNAYPSERKIYDKVISLVDFNKYPELKEAYKDFKSRHNKLSSTRDVVETVVQKEDNGNYGKNNNTRVNYLPVNIQNLDIDKFIRLLTEKDKLNKHKQFITVLESTNNVSVAICLKHFLSTRSASPLSFTLKWNGNSMVSLKFLIRLIANTNEDAARDNVIKVTSKKSSDGISKNVSKWKGPGDLWTPVYNVFEGCTSSILTAALGEEGTDARATNLNELETIADIYFECKK